MSELISRVVFIRIGNASGWRLGIVLPVFVLGQ